MAGSFNITISSLSALNIGGSKRAELTEIKEMVDRAMQVLVSSQATSISFKDRNGATAGTISWTPVNSA
ncbi:MAG TPA: hypothetical protein VFB02_16455 [Bradyrhizobium sp.]|nr:hypothetical protein [Bradyrhizobium sp.]